MKWLFPSCRGRHRQLSLMAAGGLSPEQRATMKDHLAHCAECARYFREMSLLNRALLSWGQAASSVEPRREMRLAWTRAIRMSQETPATAEMNPLEAWSARRLGQPAAWAGLALIWLLSLCLRMTSPAIDHVTSHALLPAPRATLTVFRSPAQIFAQWQALLENSDKPQHPAQPDKPVYHSPRSQRGGRSPALGARPSWPQQRRMT